MSCEAVPKWEVPILSTRKYLQDIVRLLKRFFTIILENLLFSLYKLVELIVTSNSDQVGPIAAVRWRPIASEPMQLLLSRSSEGASSL
jgi:hypothetical protein